MDTPDELGRCLVFNATLLTYTIMDPLSITAGVLALATAAAQISKAISQLRQLGEVPSKIYALRNEISDLEVVLRQIARVMDDGLWEADANHDSLGQVLNRTKAHLAELTVALERLAKAYTGSRQI